MSIRRRDFLSIAGATGLLAVVRSPLAAAGDTHPEAVAVDWDMTWVDRVTGKHRAVFDSPDVSEGAALFRANMWRNQYKTVYATTPADTSPVVVLRHQGFALTLNDDYWNKYKVGKEFKLKGDDGKSLKKNPVAPPADPASKSQSNIPAFIASGGIVLGCGLAFSGVVSELAKKEKIAMDEADKLVRAYMIPGVILQPSGVFAVLRAQEAGCAYILAS